MAIIEREQENESERIRPLTHEPEKPVKEKQKRLTRTQKILLLAADIIENEGWARGTYQKRKSNGKGYTYCSIGAIHEASVRLNYTKHPRITRTNAAEYEAQRRLQDVVGKEHITTWNDTQPPLKGKGIVIKTFRKAAGQ